MPYEDLPSSLVELHMLPHVAEEEIFGLGMIKELWTPGYRVSLRTLYACCTA